MIETIKTWVSHIAKLEEDERFMVFLLGTLCLLMIILGAYVFYIAPLMETLISLFK